MNGSEPNSPETPDIQPDADADSGKPAAAPNEWKMPAPVFKQTSGYLPQGYIEQFGAAVPKQEEAVEAPAPQAEPAAADPASTAAIEPQPDLNEQLEDQPIVAAPSPPVKKKSGIGKIILILLGIGLMIAFILGFLALIYFLFISPESSEGIF